VAGWIKADSDEKSVMAAVAKAPLAVGIEADQTAFQFYADGVFSAACGTDLDHGVVLVVSSCVTSSYMYISTLDFMH
jgi:hypothetical protein